MANRVRALISKIFNFALHRELVTFNPCHGVSRVGKEKRRETVLSDDEIRELWSVLGSRPGLVARSFQMLLLTAQRPGEVLKMRWQDISDGIWNIPAEFTKNGRSHRVPLPPLALSLLQELKRKTGEFEWVFANSDGSRPRYFQSSAKRLNGKDAEGKPVLPFHFRPHDLRRTAASGMASLGIHRDTIAKVLNHKSADNVVTGIYDQYDRLPEIRQALERWSSRLEQIITGQPAKVVNLNRRQQKR